MFFVRSKMVCKISHFDYVLYLFATSRLSKNFKKVRQNRFEPQTSSIPVLSLNPWATTTHQTKADKLSHCHYCFSVILRGTRRAGPMSRLGCSREKIQICEHDWRSLRSVTAAGRVQRRRPNFAECVLWLLATF